MNRVTAPGQLIVMPHMSMMAGSGHTQRGGFLAEALHGLMDTPGARNLFSAGLSALRGLTGHGKKRRRRQRGRGKVIF